MAFDPGLAQLLRDDLAEVPGITEKRMFGGLAFLLDGNMLCGVHKGGGMFRVGAAQEARVLAIPGARPMDFTGRPMAGFVEVDDALMADDPRRRSLLGLARGFVGGLPAK